MSGRQTELFFDGKTYDPAYDRERLRNLLGRVFEYMSDGHWHSLAGIHMECGGTEASCSARLRDLRKERFGSHTIERKRMDHGLWIYRMKRRTQIEDTKDSYNG